MQAFAMAMGGAFSLAVAVLAGEGGLKATEGFLPGADGVRLFYRQVGTGPDLVVYLHGGPGSNFRGSGTDMDPLATGRTLVMYDQRGSGRSEALADAARLTVAHHVRDLEAVREHFGAARMSLTFRLYLADPTPEKLRHAQARCDIPPAAIRNRPVVEAAAFQSLGAWDLRPLLARLKVPALVLEGADSNVPLDATREWTRALPNGRLVLIPRAGHELFVDQPDAFLEAAEEFLGR